MTTNYYYGTSTLILGDAAYTEYIAEVKTITSLSLLLSMSITLLDVRLRGWIKRLVGVSPQPFGN